MKSFGGNSEETDENADACGGGGCVEGDVCVEVFGTGRTCGHSVKEREGRVNVLGCVGAYECTWIHVEVDSVCKGGMWRMGLCRDEVGMVWYGDGSDGGGGERRNGDGAGGVRGGKGGTEGEMMKKKEGDDEEEGGRGKGRRRGRIKRKDKRAINDYSTKEAKRGGQVLQRGETDQE